MKYLAFRAFLRRHSRDNPQIKKLLLPRNAADLRAVADDCYDGYQDYVAAGDHAGPIMDFLEWLLANADEIIAIVVRIIDMFSAAETAE